MPDKNSESELDQGLKFSGEQGFFDKSLTIRYLILIAFAFSLFSFIHFREVRVEVLDLNSTAPNFTVAQTDFDFLDEEATLILKQEAVRDIGKIYRLAEDEIQQKRVEFENFLLYSEDWRQQAEAGVFDGLYRGSAVMEKALLQMRLTDAHTFQKMEDIHFPTEHYYIYNPHNILEQVTIPTTIWNSLQEEYLSKILQSSLTQEVLLDFFKKSHWRLEEDIPAQRLLRKKIQAGVADKYTHVRAGSRIIDQGERVTARHVAMLQAMKKALGENRNLSHPLTLLGTLIITVLLIGIFLAYFYANYPLVLASNRKLFLLVTIIVLTLGVAKATEFFLLSSKNNLIDVIRYPLFVPLAAILICSLLNQGIATFVSGFLAVILALTLAFDREGFLIMNLVAALVAILSIHSLRRRKEIFVICLKAWICCVAIIFSLHFYANTLWSFSIFTDILSAACFMLLTGVLVVGLLPLLESGFRIMTNVSLMEYMDPNNDLLRRLTIEAPGTYQHSVVVGNLAEAAALAIGANGLFCRVATLYHDVGKMSTSQYFTENQLGEVNIHQLLTPQESALVIMSHVPEGVGMAREAGLPEPIIDIIKEHHGTTLVYYFYRKQLEKMNNDRALVEEREFRYAGPKPRSKESGIIMIADSFEAASRSLDRVNEQNLIELIDRLVRDKFDDKQFDNCLLTCEDLAIVKKVLVKTLLAAGHSRIKYPTPEKKIIPVEIQESA